MIAKIGAIIIIFSVLVIALNSIALLLPESHIPDEFLNPIKNMGTAFGWINSCIITITPLINLVVFLLAVRLALWLFLITWKLAKFLNI